MKFCCETINCCLCCIFIRKNKMNNQLIEKIITSNNLPCPKFIYKNPVLDREVAKALSKSFVKILNLSQQNLNLNNNLRLSILENIRKLCHSEPDKHLKVEESFTTLLLEFYEQTVKNSRSGDSDIIEKTLDAFLIRSIKDMSLNTSHKSPLNPEVLQALFNLNQNVVYIETLLNDIIHWDFTENNTILRDLWTSDSSNLRSYKSEDISIKLKPEIEKSLLIICHNVLNEIDPCIEELFISDTSLKNLVQKSSSSTNCFEICCNVLNYLFMMSNFDIRLQYFIQLFVKQVKESCSFTTFSVLYPIHLNHVTVLLDIDLEALPTSLQKKYVTSTKKYLFELRTKSETDFIMLLSHFPEWFDIYFM